MKMAFGMVLAILFFPVFTTLWMIDEIFYGGYRDTNIEDVVWIVSSPRTGSTNLVDTLLEDERDFLSPWHIEAVIPFICVLRVIDGIIYFFNLFGVNIIEVLEKGVKKGTSINEDVLDHHPMELQGFVLGELKKGKGGELWKKGF